MRTWRSVLFAPAHDEKRMAKVYTRGADAVILDLEDGVPEQAKQSARARLGEIVKEANVPTLVRVNNRPDLLEADLEAVLAADASAVMVPKVERAQIVEEIVAHLTNGGSRQTMPVVALIESPRALECLSSIASVNGLGALALGVEDFAGALGTLPDPENLDLPCRLLALSAAAHGVAAFGAPISLSDFESPMFGQACGRARLMGLTGALCIHPAQVAAANEAFSSSDQEVAQAHAIISAWREGGEAGVVRLGTRMIDPPMVRQAEMILARKRG